MPVANEDLPGLHERALNTTRNFVAGVKPDQWEQPSPCEGWSVRALVNHIVSGNFWVEPLVAGKSIEDVGDRYDGDLLGAEPSAAYDDSARRAAAAFNQPGAMDAMCKVSYGPVPGQVYAGHRFIDVLIHGWDVAQGTGQDSTLDPDLVQACWEVVLPQADLLAGSGAFSGGIEAPPDASLQTKLLALLGRTG